MVNSVSERDILQICSSLVYYLFTLVSPGDTPSFGDTQVDTPKKKMGTIHNILQKNSGIDYYNQGDIIIGKKYKAKIQFKKMLIQNGRIMCRFQKIRGWGWEMWEPKKINVISKI